MRDIEDTSDSVVLLLGEELVEDEEGKGVDEGLRAASSLPEWKSDVLLLLITVRK